MIFSRAWAALMRRNLIYRKRFFMTTFCEVALPICFLAILVAIKNAVDRSGNLEVAEVVAPTFPQQPETFVPFTFQDYLTALQAKRVCLNNNTDSTFVVTGMENSNWPVPLVKCDSRFCTTNGEDASSTVCEYNIIGVAGDRGRVLEFISWLEETYPILSNASTAFPFNFSLIKSFDSSDAMSDYVTSGTYGLYPTSPKLAMGIVFNGNDPNVYDYTLRQNSTNFNNPEQEAQPGALTTPNTAILTDDFGRTDDSVCPISFEGAPYLGPLMDSCTGQYMYNGILTFQRLVHDFILSQSQKGVRAANGNFVSEAGVQYVPFPTREYTQSGFYAALSGFGPLLVTLGLLFTVAAMISYISQEKELRQKELMKMMSVSESDIGWSWYMTFVSLHALTAFILALVSFALYSNSAFPLLFLFWLLTFNAIIVFCMSLGASTSKAIRGVLIGVVFFFIGAFLPLAFDFQTSDLGLIQLISLHPVVAFSYGLSQIGQLEDQGIGLTSSTIGSSSGNVNGYTFGNSIAALIVDSVFWGVLSWYLNRVIKPDYGQAYPFYFPFLPSYWCPSKKSTTMDVEEEDAGQHHLKNGETIPYEPVGDALRRQSAEGKSIEIYNLKKEFGEKRAVDQLNLSMYSGQITALLGHNGAGKTTTIAMLTGAIAPTDGYAVMAGKDIRTQMNSIRQDVGICLQHDCLFPFLTVREHMQFFSRLKGMYSKVTKKEAEEQIDQAIRDVALFEKRNTYSKSLSGGMKRKLSVAIAFSGGSKIVILDEPTSGMDPFSRRFTWNVIRQYRQDRCIILTTHFMDEADILGDRIAIMAEGQLRCAGSSLFLKKKYGVGYQLTVEKNHEQDKEQLFEESESEIDIDNFKEKLNIDEKLKAIVKTAVPAATLLNNTGSEVRYQLPIAASGNFPAMFEGLDTAVEKGSIQSYGLSMTTLDEVFLLVARGDHTSDDKPVLASSKKLLSSGVTGLDDKTDADVEKANSKSERSSARSQMDLTKESLFFRHMSALTKKRAANFTRDKKAWFCTTLLPTLLVLMGLIVIKFLPTSNYEPITLNLQNLNPDVTVKPINPVAYNSPSNPYLCSPGFCAYSPQVVEISETNEIYGFCGFEANPIDFDGLSTISCSNNVSNEIMQFIGSGATAQENNVVNTLNSSISLFNTSDVFEASQYGAIWFTQDPSSIIVETSTRYNETTVANCQNVSVQVNYSNPAQCRQRFGGLGYVLQYNFTGLHVSPLLQVLADEAVVREATNNDQFVITATIAPLPITNFESGLVEGQDATLLFLLVVLAFPIIAGSFGSFIVIERESKAKHLQTVAGVQPSAYWLSSFFWDVLNYQLPLWCTVALLFIFDLTSLTTSNRDVFSGVVTTLILYGPAAASYTYCLSFAFTSSTVCVMVSIISGFLIGLGGPLAIFIMTIFGSDAANPNTTLLDIANAIGWILRFNPNFCLGHAIFWALNIDYFVNVEGDPNLTAWSPELLLYDVIFLGIQAVVYLFLAVRLDMSSTNPSTMSCWKSIINICCCKCAWGTEIPEDFPEDFRTPAVVYTPGGDDVIQTNTPVDSDVVSEENRVLSGDANSDLIVISQLTKVYGTGKKAVDSVSLGIPNGQCFGLLGINGAGKTTTMAILTAEFPPSSGDATLAGFSVTKQPEKTRRRIGYCPQFDAHFANMTGREHIELYATIKGVPRDAVKDAVADKLREVGLNDFDSDRLCSNYSGGMKRRLSLAIATIGNPQILFLDECSTGVDPVARREIWGMISAIVSDESIPLEERPSIILTTHSMEECEALCPRIAIMANGKLRCLGSAQHLKNKFGQGFQVEMKADLVNIDDDDYKDIITKLASNKGVEEDKLEAAFTLDEVKAALFSLTDDDALVSLLAEDNEIGFSVWREASSPAGVSLETLSAFATTEIRMRNITLFIQNKFPDYILRERQDLKARYEVSSKNTRISDLFISIEAIKEELRLSDYGVSQTSLEQVFNMHAAEAELAKQGRNDA